MGHRQLKHPGWIALFAFGLSIWLAAGTPSAVRAAGSLPFWKQLNKFSFGPLQRTLPEDCNPGGSGFLAGLAGGIMRGGFGIIDKFAEGGMVYDDTLIQEGLQDQFKIIADVGAPVVAIISRDEDGIAFYYALALVNHEEVFNAAKKYCGYFHKRDLFEGSSRRCIYLNNTRSYVTLIISSLKCI